MTFILTNQHHFIQNKSFSIPKLHKAKKHLLVCLNLSVLFLYFSISLFEF